MSDADHLLADLNPPQREAVLHRDGPLLVLAGPGSGKTRVITRRAANLVRGGVPPRNVLAITFTNKAADEMKRRIEALGVGRGMWVYTFHALGVRLLREFGPLARIQPGFTIYDEADQLRTVKDAMAECRVADTIIKPDTALAAISRAKNALTLPDQYKLKADGADARYVAGIYAAYERLLEQRNAVDFDDLLLRVALVLREHDEVTERLNIRFRYLLIDEYQDTNQAQYVIAKQLSKHHRNICATGDPDQSIYAWRGADIRNILGFERDFPDAKVVRLEQNYRSKGAILKVASQLISGNRRRKHKDLWTDRPDGEPVEVWEFAESQHESEQVAQTIFEMQRGGRAWGDFAVCYRTNALSRGLEEGLRHRGIPYKIARGVEFYNRREIRDTLAYLRVIVNLADAVSLVRIINTPPRGIGQKSIERLVDAAAEHRLPLISVIRRADEFPSLKSAAPKLLKFAELMDRLKVLQDGTVVDAVSRVLVLSGLEKSLKQEAEIEGEDRLANVQELVTAAARYEAEAEEPQLADFLTRVALTSDQDAVDASGGVVMLMTLHAAKGLEFPVVFIVGLEQGLLPHERAIREGDIEEERRLMFVGVTRAMDALVLARADERIIRGVYTPRSASQFLRELPDEWVKITRFGAPRDQTHSFGESSEPQIDGDADLADVEPAAPPGEFSNKLRRGRWRGARSEFADEPVFSPNDPTRRPTIVASAQHSPFADWLPGVFVTHAHYGIGQVVRISGSPPQTRATIRFPGQGEKTFILEHAPIERLKR